MQNDEDFEELAKALFLPSLRMRGSFVVGGHSQVQDRKKP